jgi:hypothetical protein
MFSAIILLYSFEKIFGGLDEFIIKNGKKKLK